jgi:hypothetical protein
VLALGLLGASSSAAATFTVTGTLDGTGACIGTVCPSLRSAVSKANATSGPDQINLQAGVFRLELAAPPPEDANATGDLDVSDELTIRGAGAQATTIFAAFPANESDRVIQATGNANLTLADLTVSGGRYETGSAEPRGGGIESAGNGTLDLDHVVVSGNMVRGFATTGHGGGIDKGGGQLLINDSAVLSNSIPGNGYGGGVNLSGATAQITNVTFAGNSAGSVGGAFDSDSGGSVTLAFVTITANEATQIDGGGLGTSENVRVRDSIITGNTAPKGADCESKVASEGGNVAGATCELSGPSDLTAASAGLGPLEGSPIPFLEPLAGSPALDRALAPCPATDVRGVARPQGAACDSGAVERVVPAPGGGVTPILSPPLGKSGPTKAPSLSAPGQSHSVWRAGSKLASISKRLPVGTVFTFSLDQSAVVSLKFTQSAPGRRVNGRCVVSGLSNRRKKSCKRTVTRGVLALPGHAGANEVSFQGRVSSSRKLAPGSYTLQITASNAAGRSQARTLRFTIVS